MYNYTLLINNRDYFGLAGIACLLLARSTPYIVAEVSDVKTVSVSENNTFSFRRKKKPAFIRYTKIWTIRCSINIILSIPEPEFCNWFPLCSGDLQKEVMETPGLLCCEQLGE